MRAIKLIVRACCANAAIRENEEMKTEELVVKNSSVVKQIKELEMARKYHNKMASSSL